MSWSYDQNHASDKDKIRFYIADTDCDSPLLEDEEIVSALSIAGDVVLRGAALCARSIALNFSRLADTEIGGGGLHGTGVAVKFNQRAKQYDKLAERLEKEAESDLSGLGAAGIYAGGIDVSDRDSYDGDSTLIQPFFKRGLHDREPTDEKTS